MAKRILIIGGGAAGMMCAALLGEQTKQMEVILVDHNEKLGKKLFITGKGRCNFTNACDPEEFLKHVLTNPKFLYSALYTMSPDQTIELFESWGLRTKIERGRRAFPASDHSSDVISALKKQLTQNHTEIRLNTECRELIVDKETNTVLGAVLCREGRTERLRADIVILATGGISYPSTGSTGDGYRFARELGLKVTKLYPSLVPVACREDYIREMQGLSLKNVELHIRDGKKDIFSDFGEMMFTHFGITGPLVLSASAAVGPLIGSSHLSAAIDLKPAVTEEMLSKRMIGIFEKNPNRALKNVLGELYPQKMVPVIPIVASVDPDKKVHDVTRQERARLVSVTKKFPMTLTALRGYNEAVVTKGGIDLEGIDPGTMAARDISGIYFIGEVLDLDAYTGGYNLQIAWSTAALCALEIKNSLGEERGA